MKEENKADPFCPKCKAYISDEQVTYWDEVHQVCGTPVTYPDLAESTPSGKGAEEAIDKISWAILPGGASVRNDKVMEKAKEAFNIAMEYANLKCGEKAKLLFDEQFEALLNGSFRVSVVKVSDIEKIMGIKDEEAKF